MVLEELPTIYKIKATAQRPSKKTQKTQRTLRKKLCDLRVTSAPKQSLNLDELCR